MIIVHINPTGIEEICFQSKSEAMEDLSLAVWPLVRKHLRKLHKDLKNTTRLVLKSMDNGNADKSY